MRFKNLWTLVLRYTIFPDYDPENFYVNYDRRKFLMIFESFVYNKFLMDVPKIFFLLYFVTIFIVWS